MLSVDDCWAFLELQVGGPSALPPGVSVSAIDNAEISMGVELPEDFRRLLLRHDGSGNHCISPYKIGGGAQYFMALQNIIRTWEGMVVIAVEFESDGEFGEQTGPIKKNYWNKRWIPFTENGCGDNIIIDLDPPDEGTLGQVVDWWHEGGVSTYQSASIRKWLNEVVDEIKSGVYKFGST